MTSIESICDCMGFEFWYLEDSEKPKIPVCKCGHPDVEHMFYHGSCIGKVKVYNPPKPTALERCNCNSAKDGVKPHFRGKEGCIW